MDTSWWVRLNSYILEWIVGLGLLLVGVFDVVGPLTEVFGPTAPDELVRQVRTQGAAGADTVSSAGAALRGTDHAELVVTGHDFGDRLLFALPGLVGALLLLVILNVLLRLARTFHMNDFFAPGNARHLVTIAVVVLLLGTVPPALEVLTTHLLVDGTALELTVRTPYEADGEPVFWAVLIAAAAGAFRTGTRLRQDTDGLV